MPRMTVFVLALAAVALGTASLLGQERGAAPLSQTADELNKAYDANDRQEVLWTYAVTVAVQRASRTLRRENVSRQTDLMRVGRYIVHQDDMATADGHFSGLLFQYETSAFVRWARRLLRPLFGVTDADRT